MGHIDQLRPLGVHEILKVNRNAEEPEPFPADRVNRADGPTFLQDKRGRIIKIGASARYAGHRHHKAIVGAWAE